jgi:hypothetical protein
MFACLLRSAFLVLMLGSLCAFQSSPSHAADEPDLIFKRSTVFKWVTPNDKLATYGIDDPEIEGVACHFTVPERGGLTGWIGVAEEVSDISLACRQVGPIHFKKKFAQGEDMFRHRRSFPGLQSSSRSGIRKDLQCTKCTESLAVVQQVHYICPYAENCPACKRFNLHPRRRSCSAAFPCRRPGYRRPGGD